MTKERWALSADVCPSCNGTALVTYPAAAHDGHQGEVVEIVECKDCHFAWQASPSRSQLESIEHFEASYRPLANGPTGYFATDHKSQIVALELDYLATLPTNGKRLIDIGGGSGAFAVAAARRGWLTSTVDPALDADALARLNVRAFKGFLSSLPVDEQFDVATIWDVIEHVEDPAPFLAEIRARLAPGATLVLSTGNYKSVDRLRGGRSHWIYQLDHRWYFSPESARQLLEDCGFRVVASCNRVLRPQWSGSEQHSEALWKSHLAELLKRPWAVGQTLAKFQQERAAQQWPQSGLAIFTLAASAV